MFEAEERSIIVLVVMESDSHNSIYLAFLNPSTVLAYHDTTHNNALLYNSVWLK